MKLDALAAAINVCSCVHWYIYVSRCTVLEHKPLYFSDIYMAADFSVHFFFLFCYIWLCCVVFS